MCAILRFSVYEKSHLGQSHRLYFADACALCPVHGITTDDRDWGGWSLIGTVVGTCTYVSIAGRMPPLCIPLLQVCTLSHELCIYAGFIYCISTYIGICILYSYHS